MRNIWSGKNNGYKSDCFAAASCIDRWIDRYIPYETFSDAEHQSFVVFETKGER